MKEILEETERPEAERPPALDSGAKETAPRSYAKDELGFDDAVQPPMDESRNSWKNPLSDLDPGVRRTLLAVGAGLAFGLGFAVVRRARRRRGRAAWRRIQRWAEPLRESLKSFNS